MQIMGPLGIYFDAAVLFVMKFTNENSTQDKDEYVNQQY